jgi:GntR family transcriptional regulator
MELDQSTDPALAFWIDNRTGVAPYLQLVHQVRQALRLGLLSVGDQLPTVKQVVAAVAINPNTVLKAYRELERDGLVTGRPGVGTFVTRSLAGDSLASHEPLRQELSAWILKAHHAGLSADSVEALIATTLRSMSELWESMGRAPGSVST